jgi:serine/threonine protein kinase
VRESALPAELFGKFRLERRIGEGGMGVVYCALDLALGRRVALKTLPHTNPEDADRLRREARAMAVITHPNLALILGAETWQGTPVLVLEYLAGGTLEARLAQGRLPAHEAFEIAHSMARVLVRLHAAGLLHRDVKPSNVGFTEENEPRLLDFGLVRILNEVLPSRPLGADVRFEETGFGGTPLYMSPEALDGGRPDPGFDLWGLAVVAYEAVTGRHPFERESASATLSAIRRGWTDELAALLPADAAAARELFEGALDAERARRPQTAGELADRLRKTADAALARVAP